MTIKCKICLEEKGESRGFDMLHWHLYHAHGISCKTYLKHFPNAKLSSDKFKRNKRDAYLANAKRRKNMLIGPRKWRREEVKGFKHGHIEASEENIEAIAERIDYLGNLLISGISGKQYREALQEHKYLKEKLPALVKRYARKL